MSTASIRLALAAVAAIGLLAACGSDDASGPSASTTTSAPESTGKLVEPTSTASAQESTGQAVEPTTNAQGEGCGVTLADAQALLPGRGVTENSTPDPGRCNFTWDDDGPRGADVAIVPGGRSAFEVPPGYEPLDSYGDEAFISTGEGRVSAFAFVGDDVYAADVVADGSAASDTAMRDLCLRLLAGPRLTPTRLQRRSQ